MGRIRYLSLFSGIGSFEVAIYRMFTDAECVGYSEIKPDAIKVYSYHYPSHINLGDITQIKDSQLDTIIKNKCNLIVAGFPCTNLCSVSRLSKTVNTAGLKGPESSLFFDLLYILEYILRRSSKCRYIIENNASMSNKNKAIITTFLETISKTYMNILDSGLFGVQIRKRIFWTNFPVQMDALPNKPIQTYSDVLEPVHSVKSTIYSDRIIMNSFNKLYDAPGKGNAVLLVHKANAYKNGWYFKVHNIPGKYSRWNGLSLHADTIIECPSFYTYPIGKTRTICGDYTILLDRRGMPKDTFVIRYLTTLEKERLFFYRITMYRVPYTQSQKVELYYRTVYL